MAQELDPLLAKASREAKPNYSVVYQFEKDFKYNEAQEWFAQHWTSCFYLAFLYVILVFAGQKWMANRARYELRAPLIVWNIILAAFSIAGACRTIPEIYHVIRHFGLYHSVCVPNDVENDKVSAFWTSVFIMSKLPELGDTVFIILRKQPLIFLHWYHHATVLLYAWFSYSEYTAPCRWFFTMNYTVHAFMYSYYALKAMHVPVPRFVSMVITSSQLFQMVVGCAVNLWAYQLMQSGDPCLVTEKNVKVSLLMYLSYFILFARFFYKAYVNKRAPRKDAISKSNGKKMV